MSTPIEILLVEDSPTQSEVIAQTLRAAGYNVTVVESGSAALIHLRNHTAQLVISDVVMPEMDGYELCRQIRSDAAIDRVSVLLLTELNDPSDIIAGLDCGADSFLIKGSATDGALVDRVETLLQDRHDARQHRFEPVIEVTFAKKRYRLASSRLQMLDLLLAQYEEAQRQHRELEQSNIQLKEALGSIHTLSQLIHSHGVQSEPPHRVEKVVDLLIAEDSPTQAAALESILEDYGYQVRLAADGVLALAAVRERKPDLIISDVVMPEMDGFDLCRALKEDPDLQDIPVVLLTALTDPEDIVRGLVAHADYYLTKPFDPVHLLTRVEYLLAHPVVLTGNPQPLETVVAGKSTTIHSEPQQILNLLLATYEQAVRQNRSLLETQQQLSELNDQLEQRVEDRTAKLAEEIEERKRAEAAMRHSENHLRLALETNQSGAWDLNLEDHSARRTSLHDRIFGYPEPVSEWTLETFLEHVLPEDRPEVERRFKESVATLSDMTFECRIRRADGEIRWIAATGGHERDVAGGFNRMGGIVQDITERKLAEAKLHESLREKEALIKEVHHRVKNNLQVISSLLRLESGRSKDQVTKDVLLDMKGRIMSMALLHETIYRSGILAEVDMAAYLRNVGNQAIRSNEGIRGGVKLNMEFADVGCLPICLSRAATLWDCSSCKTWSDNSRVSSKLCREMGRILKSRLKPNYTAVRHPSLRSQPRPF